MAFNNKGIFLLLSSLFISVQAKAIQISSLAEVANKNGTAVYTVKNTDSHRTFLNVAMYELNVVDGKIQKTLYNRENLDKWKINVRPAKTIIEPGFEKDFRVTLICQQDCEQVKDQVFQLAFIPSPYFAEGEKPQHAVQMAVGFASLFIVPGEETAPSYQATYDGQQVRIHNQGHNYLKATLSSCDKAATKGQAKDCSKKAFVLAERDLNVALPAVMQNAAGIQLEVSSSKGDFKETVLLEKTGLETAPK